MAQGLLTDVFYVSVISMCVYIHIKILESDLISIPCIFHYETQFLWCLSD